MRAFYQALFCVILSTYGIGFGASSTGSQAFAQAAFGKTPAKASKDGGPRRLVVIDGSLEIRVSASKDAKVVEQLEEGSIVSNMGCQKSGEHIWCKVRHFRGGVQGFADATRFRPARGPDGLIPLGVDDSRKRARNREFDVHGEVMCAQERGQSLNKCVASAARSEGADATVVVTFPNGFARSLFFKHGEFISASATMSGVGKDTDWRFENGVFFIRVDDQRYEVMSKLVFER